MGQKPLLQVEVTELDNLLKRTSGAVPCVAALGTFDGVHLGHVAILKQAVETARHLGVKSLAFTFDRLPVSFLNPERHMPCLNTLEDKIALLGQYVDEVLVMRFDERLAALSPPQFVTEVLCRGLNCRGVAVGYNYTFGHKAAGNVDTLRELAGKAGLVVEVVAPVLAAGRQVSSTRIRQLVQAGRVADACLCLGRPYALSGVVEAGCSRGRELGFPTANLAADPQLAVPADGVYVTEVATLPGHKTLGGAVTSIGAKPTFRENDRSIETYIFGFSGDLYRTRLSVLFHHRLRDIRAFADREALRRQIAADVENAQDYLANTNRLQQQMPVVY